MILRAGLITLLSILATPALAATAASDLVRMDQIGDAAPPGTASGDVIPALFREADVLAQAPGFSFAPLVSPGENSVWINAGDNNTFVLEAQDPTSTSYVMQSGANNLAIVSQASAGNLSSITQTGFGSVAVVRQ